MAKIALKEYANELKLIKVKSVTLKQRFLLYKFLQCKIMAKIALKEYANELKLIKVVAISR